jgi:hypothetical protein
MLHLCAVLWSAMSCIYLTRHSYCYSYVTLSEILNFGVPQKVQKVQERTRHCAECGGAYTAVEEATFWLSVDIRSAIR